MAQGRASAFHRRTGLDHKETCRKYGGARLYRVQGLELLSHQDWILGKLWWLSGVWIKGVKDGRAPYKEAFLERQH